MTTNKIEELKRDVSQQKETIKQLKETTPPSIDLSAMRKLAELPHALLISQCEQSKVCPANIKRFKTEAYRVPLSHYLAIHGVVEPKLSATLAKKRRTKKGKAREEKKYEKFLLLQGEYLKSVGNALGNGKISIDQVEPRFQKYFVRSNPYDLVAKVAKERGVSKSTVYGWIKKGVPAEDTKKGWMVDSDAIEAFLEKIKKKKSAPTNAELETIRKELAQARYALEECLKKPKRIAKPKFEQPSLFPPDFNDRWVSKGQLDMFEDEGEENPKSNPEKKISEIAKENNVTVQTVYRWIKESVPYHKVGKSIKVDSDDLKRFFDSFCQKSRKGKTRCSKPQWRSSK